MPTYDEIFDKVQATLVDALGVDEEDVTRGATLQGDLGAESIDFLDIVFRLERNFGIKIPRGELFPENLVADPEWPAVKFTAGCVMSWPARLSTPLRLGPSSRNWNRFPMLALARALVSPSLSVAVAESVIRSADMVVLASELSATVS